METISVKQQGFRCPDCGGQKSTEKTLRCWDCALKQKKSAWHNEASARADAIMGKRNAGMTMVEIASELGISRQRVYQVISAAGRTIRPATESSMAKKSRKGA
jgi:DNA-directed RNA polymerase sigma subunit (sigma70/sigma32)